MKTKSPRVARKLKLIKDSIRVMQVSSSFAQEARNNGLGASSFVSYTMEPGPEFPEGWTLEEARIAEAMLAQRVSKDLYADLGARELVDLSHTTQKQKRVSARYDKLLQVLGARAVADPQETDIEALRRDAEALEKEVSNG